MSRLYVIGMGDDHIPMIAARLAAEDVDMEIVTISVDDIPHLEREEGDIVADLSDMASPLESLDFTAMDIELHPRSDIDDYFISEKKRRKIERRSEYRSKKDRRNHR